MSKFCPHCKSKKPMVKAGVMRTYMPNYRKQRYLCKSCHRFSVNPLESSTVPNAVSGTTVEERYTTSIINI